MKFRVFVTLATLTALVPNLCAIDQKTLDVKISVKSNYDLTQEYPYALLKFVLDKSGVKYTISFTNVGVTTQTRDVERLKNNEGINVGWYGTSAQLEKDLVPIRFPIWRGLLGYRVFIINKNDQAKFDQVKSLKDLQRYKGDQGIGWSDIQILENSGLMQDETPYDLIFAKVNAGRTDYFSRGITEAYREVELRKTDFPNLAVEEKILLVYPFDGFFFTNKESPDIAKALEDGFKKSYADSSFKDFFYNHPVIKAVLEKANLAGRIRIDIPNPLMTPETLAIPAQYWHYR